MEWVKRSSEVTLSEVIERNVGMSTENFLKEHNTPIMNLDKVANRLKSIATEKKTVTVFADYDCDGICSGVILHIILSELKIEHRVMFPHRSTGYGISINDVERINSDVIITVDNGIAATDAISMARDKNIEVIVLDHHLRPQNGLPDANLIVDPHVFKYDENDFEDWCGAGLAFELSCLLCSADIQNMTIQFAALATVADVVILKKDNRRILKKGLELINKTKIKSLSLLLTKLELPKVDEQTIGFKLGPIINAMGRVNDDAEFVYKYFLNADPAMADELIMINEKRKKLVVDAVARARNILASECLFGDVPLVIYDPDTIEGILGIVAGRLCEELKIPVICLTDSHSSEDIIKGSARSTMSVNIKDALDSVSDLLLHYGGHSCAAGVSLYKENIYLLRERFSEAFSDLEIDASEIANYVEALEKFKPFGQGNPNPVFKINGYQLFPRMGVYFKTLGEDNTTLKLLGNNSSAIGFGMVDEYNKTSLSKNLNLVGTLSVNNYGKREDEIELISLKKIEKVEKKSALASMLAEKMKLF